MRVDIYGNMLPLLSICNILGLVLQEGLYVDVTVIF